MTAPDNNATAVKLTGICKTYRAGHGGARSVLSGIEFDIHHGERLCFIGPNGSGKTTLLRIILGIEEADSGTATLSGKCNRIAYVPQDYRNAMFSWLRLRKNLELSAASNGNAEVYKERFERLASAFKITLDLNKYPYQLSGGEQQIYLLITALITKPDLIILDEPMSAVDFGRKQLIVEHLGKYLAEDGATLLFASHDFEESVLLADRAIIFARETGEIRTVLPINLPWPRKMDMRSDPEFERCVKTIIGAVT